MTFFRQVKVKRIQFWLTMLLLLASFHESRSDCGPETHSISVVPSNPTLSDSLLIKALTSFSSGCWASMVLDSYQVVNDSIFIFSTAKDNWVPPRYACDFGFVFYEVGVKISPLTSGAYTVVSHLTLNSQRCPYTVTAYHNFYICSAFSGDVDGDQEIGLSDIVYLLNHLFKEAAEPNPRCSGDTNGDSRITLSDVVFLINHIFKSGSPPLKTKECCL